MGFDWPDVDGPAAKVEEELGEVREQLRDHPIERVLRDVRVHQILEGTNEVMRLIVSRAMLAN